jgi:hypothetical protein
LAGAISSVVSGLKRSPGDVSPDWIYEDGGSGWASGCSSGFWALVSGNRSTFIKKGTREGQDQPTHFGKLRDTDITGEITGDKIASGTGCGGVCSFIYLQPL